MHHYINPLHAPHYINPLYAARFNAKLDKESVPGCHLWMLAKVRGYGATREARRGPARKAHAIALEISLGRRLRDGFQANHRDDLCQRRDCCNPEHLYEGTKRQNYEDAVRSKTHINAISSTRTICKRGHQYDGTKQAHGWRVCAECRRQGRQRMALRKRGVAAPVHPG